MTTTALQTELEALNVMLTAGDEDPVQTATEPGNLPLAIARGILDETSRMVQSKGWFFNTEYDFPLTRDVDGKLGLPGNMLSYDVNEDITDVDPIQRGIKLYDRRNHTYIFKRDVRGTAKILLPWDELPQAARHYIAIRAARTFQVRMQVGETIHKLTQDDEELAMVALDSLEIDQSDPNFFRDDIDTAQVTMYREN